MFLKFGNIVLSIDNIGYIKKHDGKYYASYRKKASIKEIEIPIEFGNVEDSIFFMKYGFYKVDNFFINPKSISFVNAPIKDKVCHVHFSFINGLELEFKMDPGRFKIWSDNRLRN